MSIKRGNLTLKDLAKIVGVSPATASLALSGDPRVNIKTKEMVEEAARRLNYVPNEIGRSLRAKKAETIALIFPNTPHNAFSHPYFVELLEGITDVLVQKGFHLLVSTAPTEKDEQAAYDKIMMNRRADGIILWPASINDSNVSRIVESGFPVVYLGKWHHNDVITVERDDFGGAYLATEHLLKTGRTKIAHITGPLEYQVSIDRLEGYKKAIEDYKVLYDPSIVVSKDYTMESGVEAIHELMKRNISFDGLFSSNDRMAIGAMKALDLEGIKIPEEVAIVGCDDIEMASMTVPALTTIHQSLHEIGKVAATKIISLLSGQEVGAYQTTIPAKLIIRDSSKMK